MNRINDALGLSDIHEQETILNNLIKPCIIDFHLLKENKSPKHGLYQFSGGFSGGLQQCIEVKEGLTDLSSILG